MTGAQDKPLQKGRAVIYGAVILAALGAGGLSATLLPRPASPPAEVKTASAAPALPGQGFRRLERHATPRPMPEIGFNDASGNKHSLAEFRGKVILLNLWATWCAPCKVEMPALDRLQAKLGGDKFAVVAVSLDLTGPEKPADFFKRAGIARLELFNDRTGEAAPRLKASGLPLTLILDREGREVARLPAPADWDSAEALEVLRPIIGG